MAVGIPTFWVSFFTGNFDLETLFSSNLVWHGHEMIFGFSSSLLAGFLLTASAVWTKKKAYSNFKLIILVFFWLLERILYLYPTPIPLAIGVSFSFSLLFFIYMINMLWGNSRNFKIVIPILFLFLIFKFFVLIGDFYSQDFIYKVGLHGGIFSIVFLL